MKSNEPISEGLGATILGPRNYPREQQNPDLLRPPPTDRGLVPNLRFSFADAHMRLSEGGWAREVTQRELPIATKIAGVNMRLNPGAIRELHWHLQVELGYVLSGGCRITAMDQHGRTFVDDVFGGDVWFFPKAIPHSIQGLKEGCEFLLMFDDGCFSEYNTLLVSDVIEHIPREIIEANLGIPLNEILSIDKKQRWIFQGRIPELLAKDYISKNTVPQSFSSSMKKIEPIMCDGGTIRILDQAKFPVMNNMSLAIVEVEPGAMREIHWHPMEDEWQYYLSGEARMTVYMPDAGVRTFDYKAGDVGCVPFAAPHYVENTGTTTMRFLETFRSPVLEDVSLQQWLALTPRELVEDHFPSFTKSTLDKFNKDYLGIVRTKTLK